MYIAKVNIEKKSLGKLEKWDNLRRVKYDQFAVVSKHEVVDNITFRNLTIVRRCIHNGYYVYILMKKITSYADIPSALKPNILGFLDKPFEYSHIGKEESKAFYSQEKIKVKVWNEHTTNMLEKFRNARIFDITLLRYFDDTLDIDYVSTLFDQLAKNRKLEKLILHRDFSIDPQNFAKLDDNVEIEDEQQYAKDPPNYFRIMASKNIRKITLPATLHSNPDLEFFLETQITKNTLREVEAWWYFLDRIKHITSIQNARILQPNDEDMGNLIEAINTWENLTSFDLVKTLDADQNRDVSNALFQRQKLTKLRVREWVPSTFPNTLKKLSIHSFIITQQDLSRIAQLSTLISLELNSEYQQPAYFSVLVYLTNIENVNLHFGYDPTMLLCIEQWKNLVSLELDLEKEPANIEDLIKTLVEKEDLKILKLSHVFCDSKTSLSIDGMKHLEIFELKAISKTLRKKKDNKPTPTLTIPISLREIKMNRWGNYLLDCDGKSNLEKMEVIIDGRGKKEITYINSLADIIVEKFGNLSIIKIESFVSSHFITLIPRMTKLRNVDITTLENQKDMLIESLHDHHNLVSIFLHANLTITEVKHIIEGNKHSINSFGFLFARKWQEPLKKLFSQYQDIHFTVK
jgi:hypothetical protein